MTVSTVSIWRPRTCRRSILLMLVIRLPWGTCGDFLIREDAMFRLPKVNLKLFDYILRTATSSIFVELHAKFEQKKLLAGFIIHSLSWILRDGWRWKGAENSLFEIFNLLRDFLEICFRSSSSSALREASLRRRGITDIINQDRQFSDPVSARELFQFFFAQLFRFLLALVESNRLSRSNRIRGSTHIIYGGGRMRSEFPWARICIKRSGDWSEALVCLRLIYSSCSRNVKRNFSPQHPKSRPCRRSFVNDVEKLNDLVDELRTFRDNSPFCWALIHKTIWDVWRA